MQRRTEVLDHSAEVFDLCPVLLQLLKIALIIFLVKQHLMQKLIRLVKTPELILPGRCPFQCFQRGKQLPHCHIVGEIVHILVFVLILRHCLLYRSRFPHPRHFAFKRIALLCAAIQVAKALQDLLLQIRFICVVIPVFFPLVQNQPGAEHRCTQQLARIIQRVSGIILFVLAGRCHCFQQIDQRHLTRNIAIIALSNNIIQASFFLLGNVIFCSCSFKQCFVKCCRERLCLLLNGDPAVLCIDDTFEADGIDCFLLKRLEPAIFSGFIDIFQQFLFHTDHRIGIQRANVVFSGVFFMQLHQKL